MELSQEKTESEARKQRLQDELEKEELAIKASIEPSLKK